MFYVKNNCKMLIFFMYIFFKECEIGVDAVGNANFHCCSFIIIIIIVDVIFLFITVGCLEAFSVYNRWARLIIFLLGDPHLLECAEGSQD
jgi:hypothetical protein